MSLHALHTRDYARAFEVDREKSLSTRFAAYCLTVIGAIVVLRGFYYLLRGVSESFPGEPNSAIPESIAAVSLLGATLRVLLHAGALVMSRVRAFQRQELLNLASWLLIVSVALGLLANVHELLVTPGRGGTGRAGPGLAIFLGLQGAMAIFASHFFACLFLPWKPMESLRPVVPLLIANAIITLVFGRESFWLAFGSVLTYPAAALPGVAVCGWRYSRFRDRFAVERLRGQYRDLSRELIDARKLHESLFPSPVVDGPVRFNYLYEPMRQIGGDYLFAREVTDERGLRAFNMVLIDVTGHGIAAALTVNRLYGEIERLYAEHPDAGPGEVLTALNRYVHLTLASHSVYVTSLCVRIDPLRNRLEYASGGHPPAFLAGVDGSLEQLDSTAFVLGACAGPDFEACAIERPFGPGDTFIAYTDGAIEARPESGRMVGVSGLRDILTEARIRGEHLRMEREGQGGFAASILRAVETHRQGPPEDDTLVVEIRRPLELHTEAAEGGFRPMHLEATKLDPTKAETTRATPAHAG